MRTIDYRSIRSYLHATEISHLDHSATTTGVPALSSSQLGVLSHLALAGTMKLSTRTEEDANIFTLGDVGACADCYLLRIRVQQQANI